VATYKAHFTQGIKAKVQFKLNIHIGAKIEINPKGFTLRVKAKIGKSFLSTPNY
jgi:hypothetical protein